MNVAVTAVRPAYRPWLHRYCVLLAAATFVLVLAGGQVTSHGAGLSVPDWPTSYGYNLFTFPPSQWVGNIFYEHTHRLIASTVGLLTMGMVVWLFVREPRRWLRRLGAVALVAVVLQGVLGGLTVLFLLPVPISVAHACLGQAFFCLVASIALFTSRGWIHAAAPLPQPAGPGLRGLSAACVAVVFGQLLLGAIMRHTGSGLAVPDFPTAYGQWLPALDEASVASYNEQRRWDLGGLPQIERSQIVWHLLHRAGAVVAAAFLALTVGAVLAGGRRVAGLAGPALLLALLLPAQIVLGALTVLSQRWPIMASAHVAVGALMLATCVLLSLRCRRLLAQSEQSVRTTDGPARERMVPVPEGAA